MSQTLAERKSVEQVIELAQTRGNPVFSMPIIRPLGSINFVTNTAVLMRSERSTASAGSARSEEFGTPNRSGVGETATSVCNTDG